MMGSAVRSNPAELLKGALIKWNDNNHWADRDGLTPPSPLLVVAINEILQKWKDGKADIINEKPLPSVNARLPRMSVLDPHGQPVRNVKREVITISPTHWLDQNRPVEQMTWCPGLPMLITNRLAVLGGWIERPDVTCFNLYRPPRLKLGDASQAGPWLEHLHAVFNPDDATHILRWLAHRVQLPGQKINHALVLGGPQGIGKDTLLEPVKHAVGPWNFEEVSPVHLLGRFNGFVKSVILRVSEARDLGEINRFSFYDHTKVYTAAPPDVLRVDEKHLREHYVFNCLGFIITTNHKTDGIYLPADDRRHFVAWSAADEGRIHIRILEQAVGLVPDRRVSACRRLSRPARSHGLRFQGAASKDRRFLGHRGGKQRSGGR